jgi:polysaccharide export outer membrane protein
MPKGVIVRSVVMLVLAACSPLWAQSGFRPEPSSTTAGIRIELPPGIDPKVSMSLSLDGMILDLPEGAVFPDDFAAASNGLLRGATSRADGDRIALQLQFAAAGFDRIEYETSAVVLHFRSRYTAVDEFVEQEFQYLLGPDDRILVRVHNQPDLTGMFVVDRQGLITLAHVGDVRAAGLTPRQLEAGLTEVLSGILVEPRVDVEVEEYRSQWVTVGGEVNRMGRVPLHGGTQLKEILGEAGGFTDYAGEVITISRRIQGTDRTVTMTVDRLEYETGKKNPTLQHGDIIEVKRAEYCYIQGEVQENNRVRIERGMTLLRVISLAGGLTDWADRKNVKIRRSSGPGSAETRHNIKRIINGKEEDPVMQGGEMIIVPKRFL